MTLQSTLRGGLMAGAALMAMAAACPASAQAPAPASGNSDSGSIEAVVVTGTSIRGIQAVGSAVSSIGREQLTLSARATPADLLRELPQVQSLGFDESPRNAQAASSGNSQRGTTVNLRGLGASATLLLIDGKRIAPTGNLNAFVDANQLPVSAIERIEVITDGASAIYGSDAVAGVVNYITRSRFDGLEVTARGGWTDGYNQWGASVVAGKGWGSGRVVVAYNHDDRSEMRSGESPFMRQDLTRFGGSDNRVRTNTASSGLYGNVVVPRTTNNPVLLTAGRFDFYGVSANANGTGLTAANLLLNQPNLVDASDFGTYLPRTRRNQVSVRMEQSLTDRLKFSGLAFFNRRDSEIHTLLQSAVRTIPSTSPAYIRGVPGVAANAPLTVAFSLARDQGGAAATQIYDMQYQGSAALTGTFGGWTVEAGLNLSRNRNCASCQAAGASNLNVAALQAALDNGTYNPFSPTPASAAVLAAILPEAFDRNRSYLDQYSLRADGRLFDLPGGPVKTAVGVEYVKMVQERRAVANNVPFASASRGIKAAYAELYIPLLGQQATLPFVQRLLLDVAVRTSDYSDVGRTTNPKLGMTWDVVDGLSVRAAWGKSFRAPDLVDNHPEFFSSITVVPVTNRAEDPTIGLTNTATSQTNVLRVVGKNPDLVPETARNYSFGVDFSPRFLPRFRASGTYYNIAYNNQIISLAGPSNQMLANPVNRALYAPFVTAAPQPATCINGARATYNPAYQEALKRPSNIPVDEGQICTARAIIYGFGVNASNVVQSGLDMEVSYGFAAGAHDFQLTLSGSKILKNATEIIANGPVLDGRDIVNYPVSVRGRGSLTWRTGPLTVRPSANYVGPYTNNLPIAVNGVTNPVERVHSWTTFDLSVALKLDSFSRWSHGADLSLNVLNFTDKDPPVVLTTNGNAFDNQSANPVGRIVTLQLTKRF